MLYVEDFNIAVINDNGHFARIEELNKMVEFSITQNVVKVTTHLQPSRTKSTTPACYNDNFIVKYFVKKLIFVNILLTF